MFFAQDIVAKKAGEGSAAYRDRMRLLSLESIENGVRTVYSVSNYDSHTTKDGVPGRHIQANFLTKRILTSFRAIVPRNMYFTELFLDYFRFPSGYAAGTYQRSLFEKVIPALIHEKVLCMSCDIYVPNIPYLKSMLQGMRLRDFLLDIKFLSALENPLFRATFECTSLPPGYLNEDQIKHLDTEAPFMKLNMRQS